MEVISLQSGSQGNCIYVESRGVRLLFDAGISGVQAQKRLARYGRDIEDVQALIISHDHRDHSRCMGVYQRKFGLPIHVTRGTLTVSNRKAKLGTLSDVHYFTAGDALRFDHVTIETIRTPHDAVDGAAFVVDDGRRRVGILTDLGHLFQGLAPVMRSLDAVVLESNHDPQMLEEGYYPELLKRRIRGPQGHLSNPDCAELLATVNGRLRWACLAHLSADNNCPDVAVETQRRRLGDRLPLHVASRTEASEPLEV